MSDDQWLPPGEEIGHDGVVPVRKHSHDDVFQAFGGG